jgi:hypothetical protein
MNKQQEIQKYIVQSDPGFIGYATNGDYRLNREDDDGTQREIVMTPAEYAEEHPTTLDEEFYAILHITLSNISSTQITPSSEMVDALLDLRELHIKAAEQQKEFTIALLDTITQARNVLDYYEERFGEVDIPEDWQPEWMREAVAG